MEVIVKEKGIGNGIPNYENQNTCEHKDQTTYGYRLKWNITFPAVLLFFRE